MKKLFLIITCFFASVYLADAQQLNLVADAAYGKSNDWDKIFDSYYDTFYDMPIGLRKNLVVLHDGKAIVSHATRNRYSLFDENGKFLKDIKLHFTDESRKPYNIQHVAGEINGMFFTYANNMGDIYFFDVNGLIIKELKIDFLSLEMLALDDSHIAIYGSTSWTTKDRYFISILDINTGKYKIIYDSFKERNMFSANDYIISNKNIFHSPQMLKVNDKLVIVHLSDDILRIFDFYGNKISEKRLDWPQKILSVEQQIKKQRDRIASSKKTLAAIQSGPDNEYKKVNIDKGKATVRQLENGLEYIKEPVEIDWGTIAMTDSDGNILIFDETEETGKNSFHVYNLEKGTTTSVNSFNCDGYDLAITKKRLVFHKGYVYGIQELSNYDGKPLRLVRFNVEAQ